MDSRLVCLVACIALLTSSFITSAYAEVTSLKTNTSFYKGGSKIYFSGTTLSTDSSGVTLLIFDPTNKFVMLASGISDSDHAFQIVVDTSTQENQRKLSLKGIYNATAFVANKESGKTVNFIFSPDGSSIVSSPPTGLTSVSSSSVQIDLSWSVPEMNGGSPITGYKIERNDGNGFNVIASNPSTTYQDTGLTPGKQYSYRVSAINSAGTSDPSNVIAQTTLSSSTPFQNNVGNTIQQPSSNETPSINEEIQKRIENAKRLQELLHAQRQSNVAISESLGMADMANSGIQPIDQNKGKTNVSDTTNQNEHVTNDSTNLLDVKNVIYPIISLVGVGIVVTVIYSRKKRLLTSGGKSVNKKEIALPTQPVSGDEEDEDDYAMMILKNRLAKGEITVEEFKMLKDELSEL